MQLHADVEGLHSFTVVSFPMVVVDARDHIFLWHGEHFVKKVTIKEDRWILLGQIFIRTCLLKSS